MMIFVKLSGYLILLSPVLWIINVKEILYIDIAVMVFVALKLVKMIL